MRCLFCYFSIENTDESKGPWIFLAFISFGIVEPIRYPYYLFKLVNMENSKIS